MQLRAIFRAALAVAATALATAGCGDNPNLPSGVAGRYLLGTVNGQPLPFTLPNTGAGVTAILKEGRLAIEGDGDYSQILVINLTTADPGDEEGDLPSETRGTVSVSGSTIRFEPRLETSFSGTLTEGGLTYTRNAGATPLQLNFVRQP
jgi:hypothetical protein